jgi:toxin ParE1/3/4
VANTIVILDSAKEEFKEIKRYVKAEFGEFTWNKANAEYKKGIQKIKVNPLRGIEIDELEDIGITNVKYILVRQTKVVYELNASEVIVHMFIHTKRDFRAHLLKRLLRQ